ncbi:hypothetical protein E2C01_053884 [Portunus trituberculatus]|uniref:Uncharacterized protein n=1 Tax=Portunus trituberculatus TaxID=210409 RepID=A0A5B7GQJ3_PORTR|nr:hypothetical protein [Portunus trituberculatus]
MTRGRRVQDRSRTTNLQEKKCRRIRLSSRRTGEEPRAGTGEQHATGPRVGKQATARLYTPLFRCPALTGSSINQSQLVYPPARPYTFGAHFMSLLAPHPTPKTVLPTR